MTRFNCLIFTIVAGLVLYAPLVGTAAVSVELNPAEIHISAFYDGSQVEIKGSVPKGTEAFVRLIGPREEIHVKKKGKVGGLLWMNTGDVTFENAPSSFMILTSSALASLVDDPKSPIGYSSIKSEVVVEPASEDKDFLFGEFVKLKKASDLYMADTNAIKYLGDTGTDRPFTAVMPVPPKMKPGSYKVEVLAVKGGQVVDKATKEFTVRMVGFPKKLADMAFGQPLIYGIMAVVIAVLAGLLTGFLFKSKGGAH